MCAPCFLCNAASADDVWLPPNCVKATEHRFCVDPMQLGPDNPDCNRIEKVSDCLQCAPCFERDEAYGYQYLNNETGEWVKTFGCAEIAFKDIPNRAGYEYRTCDGSETFEYRCDTWYSSTKHYYPTKSTGPTCKATEKSDGSFAFSACTGCAICDEESEKWLGVSGAAGYQQMYKNTFSNNADNYCTANAQDKYRCGPGYYGSPTSSTSGCTQCPALAESGITVVANPANISIVLSSAGSTKKTDCYAHTGDIDTRVTLSDGVGNFEWDYDDTIANEGICYYSL